MDEKVEGIVFGINVEGQMVVEGEEDEGWEDEEERGDEEGDGDDGEDDEVGGLVLDFEMLKQIL